MRLAQKCCLVTGAERAAIYDLESGNVYSLNRVARNIVEEKTRNDQFWQQLSGMGLVGDIGREVAPEVDATTPEVGLNFMWLELTDSCNLRCVHCYGSSGPEAKDEELRVGTWRNTIKRAADLGCRKIQLTGGEAFKYGGVLDLATFARETGYTSIEIFTNATLLTLERVRTIKELGVHIAVSLYSSDSSVHDQVTQTPGSFRKTRRGLTLLREFEIPTRVAVVVTRYNESTVAQTQSFVQSLGLECGRPDVIRPTGRGCIPDSLPTEETINVLGMTTKPNFRTSRESFERYHHWNSCWAGKIAITSRGDVLPCVFAREHIVGNILQTGLEGIAFGENLQRLWRLTKDDVDTCKDCEYRYACKDCRPLAEALGGTLRSKYPRCTYNPYAGTWGNTTERR